LGAAGRSVVGAQKAAAMRARAVDGTPAGPARPLGAHARGGFRVGVISHVEELKSRIRDRLTVRALGDGTSILTCPMPGVLFDAA